MKIKKMYQGNVPENKILNTYSESQTNTYSCDYINKIGQMIRVYNTTEQTINSNTTTRFNFNAIKHNTADSLTFEDSKIIIGKGVHTVLVNGRWTKWGTYSKYIYMCTKMATPIHFLFLLLVLLKQVLFCQLKKGIILNCFLIMKTQQVLLQVVIKTILFYR